MAQSFVLIEKNGTVKGQSSLDLTRDILYTKCGFKKKEQFEKRHTWYINMYGVCSVELWARDSGRSGQDNKYKLPPPVDSAAYFGTMALICVDDKEDIGNMTRETWCKIYDFLFEGIETESVEPQSDNEVIMSDIDASVNNTPNGCDGSDEETTVISTCKTTDYLDEDDETNIQLLAAGLELEEEEYYYSDKD